jgi:hypothetical protein
MVRCPRCKIPLRLLKGEKFWVHEGHKKLKCPIFSIPNDPKVVAALTDPDPPPAVAMQEAA